MEVFEIDYVFGPSPEGPFLVTERLEATDLNAATALAAQRVERETFSFQDGDRGSRVVNGSNVLYCNVRPAPGRPR